MIDRVKKIQDSFKRKLMVLGLLTSELEKKGLKPILVGGNALEIYSLGGYTTLDTGIVCSDRAAVGEILERMGFTKEGRFWINEEVEMAIEIPDTVLAGSEGKVETLEINGYEIYVIGKEDLIVDRMNACVYWKSSEDCRWVKELLLLYHEKIDMEYLKNRCKEEGTLDRLMSILREVEVLLDEMGRVD